MKGRKPMTDHERKVLGFPERREAGAEPSKLTCPDWLPDGARQIWNRLAPDLVGALDIHRDQFADYCLCLHRLQELEQTIGREGPIIKGAKGTRKHPALQCAREYRQAVQRWAQEFGLTPASAAKTGLAPSPPDPDDDILD